VVALREDVKDGLIRGTKSAVVIVRATAAEKAELWEVAKDLNITLSKYVLGLHRLAIGKDPELFIRKAG